MPEHQVIGAKSVAAGDVNGDGKAELVVGTLGRATGNVAVLLGNGDGTFGSATNFPVPSVPQLIGYYLA